MAAFLLAVVLGLLSNGVHHDDDLTHFLMARWSAVYPEYLLNFWARPGFTAPMSVIAWIGSPPTAWHVCRVASAVVTLGATLLAIRVAARIGVRPLWAVALACVLQPMATVLSYTTLVENFASLYIIAAVALLLGSRPVLASAVFSLAFVTRYDTLVLLPIWWLAIWFGRFQSPRGAMSAARRLGAMAISLWASALHLGLLTVLLGAKPWVYFATPGGSTDYAPAGPLVYVPQLILAIPPVILAMAIVGGGRLASAGKWLVPAMAGTFILAHVVLRARGMYASGGFARFLVAVAPLVAICAAAGLVNPATDGFAARRRRGIWLACAMVLAIGVVALRGEARAGRISLNDWRPYIAAIAVALTLAGACLLLAWWPPSRARHRAAVVVAGLLGVTVAVQFLALVRPLRVRAFPGTVFSILAWLDHQRLSDRPVFTATPWMAYFQDVAENPRIRKSVRLVASMPVGTIVIWDQTYCPSDYHRLAMAEFENNPAYRPLSAWHTGRSSPTHTGVATTQPYPCAMGAPDFYVFEKISETPIPAADPPAYPPDILPGETPSGRYYVPFRRR